MSTHTTQSKGKDSRGGAGLHVVHQPLSLLSQLPIFTIGLNNLYISCKVGLFLLSTPTCLYPEINWKPCPNWEDYCPEHSPQKQGHCSHWNSFPGDKSPHVGLWDHSGGPKNNYNLRSCFRAFSPRGKSVKSAEGESPLCLASSGGQTGSGVWSDSPGNVQMVNFWGT